MIYKIVRASPDELCHYGIPGQKHGHRRFQNTDGTWTPEGQKRYSTDTDGEYGEPGGERSDSSRQSKRRKRGRDVVEEQSKRKLTPSQKIIKTGFTALNAYWAYDSFKNDWL